MDYELVGTWAGRGAAPGQFAETLHGLAAGPEGMLYAVGDTTLKSFSREGVLRFSRPTRKPGHCVHCTADHELWVGQEGQIERFDATGTSLGTWHDAARLGLVTAIETRPDAIVLADSQDRCLRHFDRAEAFRNNIGKDNRLNGFVLPNGHLDFVIDRAGIIQVPNPGKLRVEHYTVDGKLLGHFGGFQGADPAGFRGCCNPTNIALTAEGLIVVTEKAGPRVKIFAADGAWQGFVGEGDFDVACKNMDVTVDAEGRIYVADTARLQIRVYARRAEAG